MNADDKAINPASHTVPGGGTGQTTEFRCTPRQRRNLLIAVVLAFVVAVVGGVIAVGARRSGAAEIAVIGGLCGVIFLYAYLAYVLARTVSGPGGISGRGLAGRYEYRWGQIDNVACRAFTSRGTTTYTIILTTTDGDRIRLGAPVSGGLMTDRAFAAKFAQIRGAWQASTGRTGPEVDTKSIWTRGLVLLTAGITVQFIAGAAIAATVSYDGPAFTAHDGGGAPGVFTSGIVNCPQPGCSWFGRFTADDGSVKYATLAPGGPFIGQPDVIVPAVDSGAKYTVYPAGGGTAWEGPAAGLAGASAVVLVVFAAELIVGLRLRRGRRRRARAGLARLGYPAG